MRECTTKPLTCIHTSCTFGSRTRVTKTRECSHNLVTIPPAGWIDVAHRHGTRVLGTFITEWDKGYDICESRKWSMDFPSGARWGKLLQVT